MGQYWFLEKPLASKNRILYFARFQNYKYILIPKTYMKCFMCQTANAWLQQNVLCAGIANSLYQDINLPGPVTFWQLYSRDINIQTAGLTTFGTFKVNVLMPVL